MQRRELIGSLGATALLSFVSSARADDHDQHHESFEVCSRACADCQLACHSCHHHCEELVVTGKKEHLVMAKLCADCGDICSLTANIVARHGALAAIMCELCAKACDECGRQCAKFENDPILQKCAEECKKCVAACQEMMKHASHKSQ